MKISFKKDNLSAKIQVSNFQQFQEKAIITLLTTAMKESIASKIHLEKLKAKKAFTVVNHVTIKLCLLKVDTHKKFKGLSIKLQNSKQTITKIMPTKKDNRKSFDSREPNHKLSVIMFTKLKRSSLYRVSNWLR